MSDADLYSYSPFPTRPALSWPSGAGVAFCPVINIEHYENVPPEDAITASDVYGGIGQGGARRPQITRIGNRDYGLRVGFYRLADYFTEQGFAPSLAIDAMAAERYPEIVSQCVSAGWEVLCHGIGINRAVTSAMSAEDEAAYVAEAKERVEQAAGVSVRGWYGPSSGESGRSLQILADAGFGYDVDWPNDDQPYWFATTPPLLSLPLSMDLDDNYTILGRGLDPWDYATMISEATARLATEGATTARYLSFALNPFVSGQPWRFSALAPALTSVLQNPAVWATQPGSVLDIAGDLIPAG
jgi:allantoinase